MVVGANRYRSVDEDEIELRTEALRKKLTAEAEGGDAKKGRGLKAHQVHELAAAKIEESERLRKALGISADYEEGAHWRRAEERLKEAVEDPEAERRGDRATASVDER